MEFSSFRTCFAFQHRRQRRLATERFCLTHWSASKRHVICMRSSDLDAFQRTATTRSKTPCTWSWCWTRVAGMEPTPAKPIEIGCGTFTAQNFPSFRNKSLRNVFQGCPPPRKPYEQIYCIGVGREKVVSIGSLDVRMHA